MNPMTNRFFVRYYFFLLLVCARLLFLEAFVHRPKALCTVTTQQRRQQQLAVVTIPTPRQNTVQTEQLSAELIELLTDPRSKQNNERIAQLVDELVASPGLAFDPQTCLDGPLFVSRVVTGERPLWERIGGWLGIQSNRQGQQYTYTNDGEKSVINYAEIFGPVRRVMTKAFHLRAYGTYEPDYSENKEMQQTEDKFANPFEWFMSLGGKANENTKIISRDKKLKCPADFIVTVNKASIVCFGQSFDIRIAGQGYLRVLYADPKLRIFISPNSTTDDRWEKAGLVVAQVRVDLVDPDFTL